MNKPLNQCQIFLLSCTSFPAMTAQNNRPSQEIEYIYPPLVLFRYFLQFPHLNAFAAKLQTCRLFSYTPAKSPETYQLIRHPHKLSQNPEKFGSRYYPNTPSGIFLH